MSRQEPNPGKIDRIFSKAVELSGGNVHDGLMTMHNLRFYQKLMQGLRDAIANGELGSFTADFLEKLSLGP